MAGKSASIAIKILGDDSNLKKALGSAESSLGKLSNKFTSTGKKMMKAGAFMTAGVTLPLVAALKKGIDLAAESEKINSQLNAVLKSTGAEAWISKDALDQRALALQNMLGIDDDVIKSGNNMLLTFTNVRNEVGAGNDVFDQATDAALNMSTALGMDLVEANKLVGKALNDPIAGMAALRRSGVQVTDAQKEQIEAFMATGDVMGAQKVLLGELETQFGGSAAAAADTFSGRMAIMRERFNDILQSIAERVMPWLEKLGDLLEKGMTWWDGLGESGQKVAIILAAVAAAIGPLTTVFGALFVAIGAILSPVGLVVVAIAALVAAFVYFYKTNKGFREFVDKIVAAVRDALGKAFKWLTEEVIPKVVEVFNYLKDEVFPAVMRVFRSVADTVTDVLGAAFGWLQEHVFPVISEFGSLVAAVVERVIQIVRVMAPIVSAVFKVLVTVFRTFAAVIVPIIRSAFNTIRAITSAVWNTIRTIVQTVLGVIRGIIQTVTGIIRGDWSKVWQGIRTIFSSIWDGIRSVVQITLDTIRRIISGAWEAVRTIFSNAWNGIKGIVSSGINGVVDFVRGLPGRLSGALSTIKNIFTAPFRAAFDGIKSLWNNTLGGKGFDVPSWVPGIGGKGFKFPTFHSGGIVPGAVGMNVPAILQAGETVRTVRQEQALQSILRDALALGAAGRPGMTGTPEVHVHFHGPVARDSVKWVADQVEEAVRTGSSLPRLRQAVGSR
jgi:phage-related minor tail protein